ncbi:transcription factor HES-5-like [Myxocyprinus asiaticus]|uniref:transcription factor HES-5-like n=1 Tax=Myxocyprinus asiaticus TaxID=70543 RepID=UPI0022224C84|nr:transcription factor HES-5-like [Myxocyprinus asiaticus]
MTPTIISKEHLPLNNKSRKPIVEKMRRERINSSIEQLKCLLAPEFLNQQSDSKLEKADILEMTLQTQSHVRRKRETVPASSGLHSLIQPIPSPGGNQRLQDFKEQQAKSILDTKGSGPLWFTKFLSDIQRLLN